jgi:endoglucanase Acf2
MKMTGYFINTCLMMAGALCFSAENVEFSGAGSYLTKPPKGVKEPPPTIYKTENVKGPMPTNDWWSSLAWLPLSEPMYAHPLILRAEMDGLRVGFADKIAVNKVGIFGAMPGGKNDFTLGHSAAPKFADARVHDFSDWFVTAEFAADGKGFKATFGHGSPFVYATFDGGDATISFDKAPEVWAGSADKPVLGVLANGKAYALFGPSGCKWKGLDSKQLTCELNGKNYFSLAVLPEKSQAMLALFANHAYAHVTGSKVEWSYDEKTAIVTTKFSISTKPMEGQDTATLFALYPHQWTNSKDKVLEATFPSVRGVMKLAEGSSFSTQVVFPGVMPSLPDNGDYDREILKKLVEEAIAKKETDMKDTYWGGKRLGLLASLLPIAEQMGANDARKEIYAELKDKMEKWLTATAPAGEKSKNCFYYNKNWGTLIGYPASYGSETDLSDHHFHYGYFLRAAAEIARHEASWGGAEKFGPMVRLLIRDIASPDRDDAMFPFLRNFDPYAGHCWASGKSAFFDGNNHESSSEAMNAWAGIILFGQATGDVKLRDLGIYLFTTESESINQYWFDVEGKNRPKEYTPSVVTMVWGAKGVNETWFSNKPDIVHGINWMPFHGGSLYLGRYPDYVRRNYAALVAENKSDKFADWPCQAMMYRALSDPDDAIKLYDANPAFGIEAGNTRANVYHWIHNLNVAGQVDRTITADYPLYAAFKKDGVKTYMSYNMSLAERKVNFSDGTSMDVPAHGYGVQVVKKQP